MKNYFSLSVTGIVAILLTVGGYNSLASQRDTQLPQSVSQKNRPSADPSPSPQTTDDSSDNLSPSTEITPSRFPQTMPSPSTEITPSRFPQTMPSPATEITPSRFPQTMPSPSTEITPSRFPQTMPSPSTEITPSPYPSPRTLSPSSQRTTSPSPMPTGGTSDTTTPSSRPTASPSGMTTPSPRSTASPSSTTSPSPRPTSGSSTNTDKSSSLSFMNKAAQGGMAEVQLGKLAQKKASSSQVKQFGQRMVKDHTQSNQKLIKIFQQKGITPPTSIGERYSEMRDQLTALSGKNFDQAYMSQMVQDHTEDVADFQREADSSTDPQVKAFASQTLPILKEHLQQARTIDQKLTSSKNP